jgi:C4-dicarboxylate-specific signal transduction histidine kinase
VSAIAAPVIVADQVQAVLEFYTRHNAVELGISLDFFKVFAIQLSRVYEKLESARKEREQLAMLAQASKMATLGELSAGVAHEINNPVSTISLISEIIKRLSRTGKLSPEELATQLARLDLCLKRISKIVSELQAFSRDATQDGFLQASIKTIVEETLDLCQARLMRSRIKLQVDEIDPTWSIECRESQISQVLLNLLSNAHDAVQGTEKAWIALSVKELGEHFEISVTDSGHGIPESIAQKVMKPFFTTKPLGKGTGLGLSISSNIMIDHHGELRVDTTSANTRFVMTLPKKRQEQIFHETA